jgi:S1-C subfamily serine protease
MKFRRAVSGQYWAVLIVAVVLASALTYSATVLLSASNGGPSNQSTQSLINLLQSENQQLRAKLAAGNTSSGTILGLDPVAIYNRANASVVTVQGVQTGVLGNASVLGSGFAVTLQSSYYIITNFHVVQNMTQMTVTFSDGNAYAGRVVGTDPYSDLAVVSAAAPAGEFHPLSLTPSSTLRVGQPLVAIGNPFGLSGSMTFGICSQLGRTISESLAGNFPIADVIQFSAPINPGNSGGPLLDANGTVIGMTTAIVQSSQGVGFAIPSDTIIRELPSLVTLGKYADHPYLGIQSVDMNYQLAKLEGVNSTYGVLIENVVSGGPAAAAGLRAGTQSVSVQGTNYLIGGDVIVSINGTRIVNTDALSTYLEENTFPGQTIVIGAYRSGTLTTFNLVLGTRPPPPV